MACGLWRAGSRAAAQARAAVCCPFARDCVLKAGVQVLHQSHGRSVVDIFKHKWVHGHVVELEKVEMVWRESPCLGVGHVGEFGIEQLAQVATGEADGRECIVRTVVGVGTHALQRHALVVAVRVDPIYTAAVRRVWRVFSSACYMVRTTLEGLVLN